MHRFSRFTSSLVIAALLASLVSLPLAAQAPAAQRQLVQPPAAGVSVTSPLKGFLAFLGRLVGLSGAASVAISPPVPVLATPGAGADGSQTPPPPASGGEGRGTMDPNGAH